jgi:hypothetical protein
MDKLKTNGFAVRYVHPNAIFICWHHWIPSYVRTEIKKKTGIVIDEHGKKVDPDGEALSENNEGISGDDMLFKMRDKDRNRDKKKGDQGQYKPINTYKPSGNFIYNEDLLDKLEDKINFGGN